MDPQGWLSGAVGAVIGAVITLVGTHFFTRRGAKDDRATERLNAAAAELHAAFADELAHMRSAVLVVGATYEALTKAFPKHDLAVAKFREFVPPAQRPAFDAAWRRYFHPRVAAVLTGEKGQRFYLGQYLAIRDEEEASARAEASSNIKSILNFARHH